MFAPNGPIENNPAFVKTTSFWRNYIRRYNDVIITSYVHNYSISLSKESTKFAEWLDSGTVFDGIVSGPYWSKSACYLGP